MKKIAVITGASSGMGREFVYAIDKDMELDELCDQLTANTEAAFNGAWGNG